MQKVLPSRIRAVLLGAVVVAPLGAGCSSAGTSAASASLPSDGVPATSEVVAATADELIPSESLEDWVTFADAIAIIEATSEADIPPTKEAVEIGEGMIGRKVTVRLVDLLWFRPGMKRPPEKFSFTTTGWVFTGEKRRPVAINGGARIEVGQRYLVPLIDFDAAIWTVPEDKGWGLLGVGTTYRYVDGVVQVGEGQRSQAVSATIARRSSAEIAGALSEISPLPEPERIAYLEEVARELGVDPRPR